MTFEPTDKQLICKHERLRRTMTLFGIAYRCETCELLFDEPDVRTRGEAGTQEKK